jgi:hypothetical protein
LFDAFRPFEFSIGRKFFEKSDDFIGAKTTDYPGKPRSVTLKNKEGARITLQEVDGDDLWVVWILPMVEQSQQILCPYKRDDWEKLIEVSDRAFEFIPLPDLQFVHARTDHAKKKYYL